MLDAIPIESMMGTMNPAENLAKVSTVGNLELKANSLLHSAEARTIDGPPWMRTKELPHTNPTETILGTRDDETNTSFLIQSGPEPGMSYKDRYTMIRWLVRGEDKGDLPGGWIKILQRDGKDTAIASGKSDSLSVENDKHWESGGAYEWYDIDQEQSLLSSEEYATILSRLSSSSPDIEFTKNTAQIVEADYEMVEASLNFQEAQKSSIIGRRGRIEAARKQITEASKKWDTLQASLKPLFKEEHLIENGERHVVFGDISLIEDLENRISDEDFRQYQEDFELFKRLVENASDPTEQTFLSSPMVFRTIIGLEPESGFFPNEARFLYKSLKKADASDRFALFVAGEYGMEVSFLHLRRAGDVLQQNKAELGLNIQDGKIQDHQIVETTLSLFNDADPKKRNLAFGLLSGFPKDSVNWWIEKWKEELNEYPLKALDEKAVAYLESEDPVIFDPKRIREFYTRPYLKFGDIDPKLSATEIGIHDFGPDLVTNYPPSTEVLEHCQKLLELDRRLGVSKYIAETKKLIETKKSLQDLVKNKS